MERVRLPGEPMTRFDSVGVTLRKAARLLHPNAGFAVDVVSLTAGGRIGAHPTSGWQLLAVVSGEGWAVGGDGRRSALATGDAVLWAPGEVHESGTAAGMVAVVVQAQDALEPPDGVSVALD